MPAQILHWPSFLFCGICNEKFQYNAHRPVTLGCGHTFCKDCLRLYQLKKCPLDQSIINFNTDLLPENYALLQLLGERILNGPSLVISLLLRENTKYYLDAYACILELTTYLKSFPVSFQGASQKGFLSTPLQKKLIMLMNCQLIEEEGRRRAMRVARALGERVATELILLHQDNDKLSANLWAAVRARGCQFLGPTLQKEILNLVLLALKNGSVLSRKNLIMFVLVRLIPRYPHASKTIIGHVVHLLYRASCFEVSKVEGDSSLLQLRKEFCTYKALKRQHDSNLVQIATEDGFYITPEKWSSLLYGDLAHTSYMHSILTKHQVHHSAEKCVQDLVIALQRTGDPGNLSFLRPQLELLVAIDPSPDAPPPLWRDLKLALEAAKIVVKTFLNFVQNFDIKKFHTVQNLNVRYKTSMCWNMKFRGSCSHGVNCSFAHSEEELKKHRAKKKLNNVSTDLFCPEVLSCDSNSTFHSKNDDFLASNVMSSCPTSEPLLLDCSMLSPMFATVSISESSPCISTLSLANVHNSTSFSNLSSSHSELKASHAISPESPAYHLLAKSPHILSPQSSHQALSTPIISCPENNPSCFFNANAVAAIPSVNTELPVAKLNLNNNCFSQVKDFPCLLNKSESSTIPYSPPFSQIFNPVHNEDSLSPVSKLKNEQFDYQTSTDFKQEKTPLLTTLVKDKQANAWSPISDIIAITEENPFKTVEENNAETLYSSWTSAGTSAWDINNNNSSSPLISPCNEFDSIVPIENSKTELIETEHSTWASFRKSDNDEIIPFDLPLVSKYGHISRNSKNATQEPVSVPVNTTSETSELTSETSEAHSPLSSASLGSSFHMSTSLNCSLS